MYIRFGIHLLKDAVYKFLDDRGQSLGAAIAFYSALSLSPLLIVILGVAAMLFGEDAARGEIVQQIHSVIGTEAAELVEQVIAQSQERKNTIWASIIAAVTLMLGASMVFTELQSSLNEIWKVPGRAASSGFLQTIRNKLLSFSLVCGTAFLLLVSLTVSAVLSAINTGITGWIPDWGFAAQTMHFVLTFGLTTLLFAMIFKWLPETKLAWSDVWLGAAFTALLFGIGRNLIGVYLGHTAVGSTYGAAGALVVFLVWVYYSTQILLLGAEVTFVYATKYGSGVRERSRRKARRQLPNADDANASELAHELWVYDSVDISTTNAHTRGTSMSSMSTEQFARNASASKSGETARLERRLASLADAGPTAIDERLAKLEWEWTAGRLTKVALGTVIVLGLGLTALLNPWWMILPTVAGLLLLQYCFLKTSWLAQIFRSFGYRCGSEVENEKIALKVLRGDFRTVPTVLDVENHDDISRFEGEGGLVAEPDDTKVEPKDAARMVLEATGRM